MKAALNNEDMGSSDDEGVRPDRGSADEDEESVDEDFQADTESDVAEEFDSEHESSGSDAEMEEGTGGPPIGTCGETLEETSECIAH